MNEKMKKRLYWVIGAIVIIACGIAYYYLYYTKTPEYTCTIIGEAYQEHDVYKVHRHVDVDNILDKFVDDAIYNDPKLKENPFALALLPVAKKAIIATGRAEVDKKIMSDHTDNADGGENTDPTNELSKASGKISFGDISSKKNDDNNAEIYLNLKEPDGTEHQLTMKAHRLEDGTWRIYEIPGLYQMAEEINSKK